MTAFWRITNQKRAICSQTAHLVSESLEPDFMKNLSRFDYRFEIKGTRTGM